MGWLSDIFCKSCFGSLGATGSFCTECYRKAPPEERFADSKWAKAATPDGLIAAHCIQSIAKNFDDWELRIGYSEVEQYLPADPNYKLGQDAVLINPKKDLIILFRDLYDAIQWRYQKCDGFLCQGVPLDTDEGGKILAAFCEIRERRKKLEAEARAAKQRMEENEKKWNLAESLLGMKRLPGGALVPKDYDVTSFEGNKFAPCKCSCCDETMAKCIAGYCEGK